MNKLLSLTMFLFFVISSATSAATPKMNIEDTVVKMAIADDVSFDDAIASMKLRANSHNMKLVAELLLSKQIKSMGKKSRRMDIYQFCDPLIAQSMVEANIHFAAYLPCRIALVEDEKGKGWLVMMNLDMMLQGATLNKKLKVNATKVRDVLMDIMQAGANGDL
jgi:uncharacterized protein (DUF302 family)